MTVAILEALYRYPVKGMTPQPLLGTKLTPGETIPLDRAWAIENGPGRFDPAAPKHLPKIAFVMLMRDQKLAQLQAAFDEATGVLSISRDGRPVVRGDLAGATGRQMIEQFLAAYLDGSLRGAPRIVSSPGHSFSDVKDKCVHIVSRGSLAELERAAGRALDPLRFRPNLVLSGWPPWMEFGLVGKSLTIGPVRLDVFTRTQRCAATDVDPATGARDTAIPQILQSAFGHSDFGVYARVATAGEISVGDRVELS
ncbi:MAG: MOSC domain-containing protein [Hyphomicrobiaceae bacterium]|nr:MOSC domain-containing protein [Hyphomicrobiaceae bacterium]